IEHVLYAVFIRQTLAARADSGLVLLAATHPRDGAYEVGSLNVVLDTDIPEWVAVD
ncbi:hypothetical protein FRC09_010446, partial [Ceratobasidium sp. 395]